MCKNEKFTLKTFVTLMLEPHFWRLTICLSSFVNNLCIIPEKMFAYTSNFCMFVYIFSLSFIQFWQTNPILHFDFSFCFLKKGVIKKGAMRSILQFCFKKIEVVITNSAYVILSCIMLLLYLYLSGINTKEGKVPILIILILSQNLVQCLGHK